MQPIRKKVRFTYQDYSLLPSDKRYELIDGDLHMTPSSTTRHQIVSLRLARILSDFVEGNDLGLILQAPMDVVLSTGDVIQPDILFVSKERLGIVAEKNVQGAPDLVIEILSPASQEWDREIKKKLYEKHGVLEYWIVDPDAKAVEVYAFTEDGFRLVQTFPRPSRLTSPLLKSLQIPLEKVFS